MLRIMLCTVLAAVSSGCASGRPEFKPRFQPATQAEALATAECQREVAMAGAEPGPSLAARMASASVIASKVIVGDGATESNLGWYVITAPLALAAGAAAAVVGAGRESAGAKADAERYFANCLRRLHPAQARTAPARDGDAELRALGVETAR